jgi:Zn-finger nucleic acid-binding protein
MFDNCPKCKVTWLGGEVPDGLMQAHPNYTREKAETAAADYGWTPENKLQFKTNMIGVQYAYDNPEHYDGVSEWKCTVCGARFNRWTNEQLADNEIVSRHGKNIIQGQ